MGYYGYMNLVTTIFGGVGTESEQIYNEVRFFDEFSKGLVHRNLMKISPGSFFSYFRINGSLWIYEFGHDHI